MGQSLCPRRGDFALASDLRFGYDSPGGPRTADYHAEDQNPMPHVIDCDKCTSCGSCAEVCPAEAIAEGENCYVIDPDLCTDCDLCSGECPVEAITEQ